MAPLPGGPHRPAPRTRSHKKLVLWLGIGGGTVLVVVIVLVAVLAVLVRDAAVSARRGAIDTSGTPSKELRWSKPFDADTDGVDQREHGMWVAHGRVVRYLNGTLTGYDLANGTRTWSLGAQQLCGAAEFDDDAGYAWARADGGCRVLMRIDSDTGEVLAKTNLVEFLGRQSGDEAQAPDVVRAGDRLVLRDKYGRRDLLATVDATNPSKTHWRVESDSSFLFSSTKPRVTGTSVIVTGNRLEGDPKYKGAHGMVESLDLATGDVEWRHKAPAVKVVSTSPLVVSTGTQLRVLNPDTGRLRSVIDVDEHVYDLTRESTSFANGTAIVEDGGDSYGNDIYGYDLKTGKELWRASDPDYQLHLIGSSAAEDRARLVGLRAGVHDDDAVLKIAPRTGRITALARLEGSDHAIGSLPGYRLVWTGRRFVAEFAVDFDLDDTRFNAAPLVYG